MQQFYQEDEARKILELAVREGSGGLSHQQLEEAAAELGIPPEAVQRAAEKLREEQADQQLRKEFKAARRSKVGSEVGSWFSTGLVCVLIWFFTTQGRGYFWPGWVIGPWGIFMMLEVIPALLGLNKEHEFQDWKQKKIAREQRKEKRKKTPSYDHDEVAAYLEQASGTNKIEAIKGLRERYKMTLKDAKDTVDAYEVEHPGSFY